MYMVCDVYRAKYMIYNIINVSRCFYCRFTILMIWCHIMIEYLLSLYSLINQKVLAVYIIYFTKWWLISWSKRCLGITNIYYLLFLLHVQSCGRGRGRPLQPALQTHKQCQPKEWPLLVPPLCGRFLRCRQFPMATLQIWGSQR